MFGPDGDLSGVDDDELCALLRDASAEVNQAQVRRLAVAAEWDRRQAWASDGAYNGRCWLAHECTLSRSEAYRVLRTAKVVASAPLVAAAVADGTLAVSKAEVLASAVTSRVADALVRDQEMLLEALVRLSVDEARKALRFWQLRADDDGAEPEVPHKRLRFGVQDDGTTHLAGILDAEDGAQLRSVIDQIADQLWRERRSDPERERPPVGMGEQLRADALMEMVRRSSAADPTRSGARPLISVIIDLDTLEGRAGHPAVIQGGGFLTAEDVRRLACDANISRVFTDRDGVILDMGRLVRTATPGQWRFMRLRDGGCTWPGCDRPPSWCQAHHIIWWENGGLSDVSQMTLLCGHHHHQIHDAGWHLERLDDGGLSFTGPDGRTIIRPPPPPPWLLRPLPPKISPMDAAAIRARVLALTA